MYAEWPSNGWGSILFRSVPEGDWQVGVRGRRGQALVSVQAPGQLLLCFLSPSLLGTCWQLPSCCQPLTQPKDWHTCWRGPNALGLGLEDSWGGVGGHGEGLPSMCPIQPAISLPSGSLWPQSCLVQLRVRGDYPLPSLPFCPSPPPQSGPCQPTHPSQTPLLPPPPICYPAVPGSVLGTPPAHYTRESPAFTPWPQSPTCSPRSEEWGRMAPSVALHPGPSTSNTPTSTCH